MEETKRFSISLNQAKYAWLSRKAEQGHRSMSGQLNKIIDEVMKREEEGNKKVA